MQDRLTAQWKDTRLVHFDEESSGRTIVHASNFSVEWLTGAAGQTFSFGSDDEAILIFPSISAKLDGTSVHDIAGRSVVITPPGAYCVTLKQAGAFAILATHRSDQVNGSERNPEVAELERIHVSGSEVRVFHFDDIEPPADNPRLRFLRSSTMSINLVEYDGPRDRALLSPHAHADFEQVSLTITGTFTHHLRANWGRDADLWRDDLHLHVQGAALVVIPPKIIHTTEGIGAGKHLLFDVFAPPRDDFIAKGWVYNAPAYAPREPLSS